MARCFFYSLEKFRINQGVYTEKYIWLAFEYAKASFFYAVTIRKKKGNYTDEFLL